MSGPQEEEAPPPLVSHPIAWHPPAVVAHTLPSGHPSVRMEASSSHGLSLCGPKFLVPTLVLNLLLLGLPLLGGDEHPVLQRENVGVESFCHPGSPGRTGGHPCLDASRILGSVKV